MFRDLDISESNLSQMFVVKHEDNDIVRMLFEVIYYKLLFLSNTVDGHTILF